jgi:hypothetical protein
MNSLFGPLGRDNCVYFYFLSILFFISFIIILLLFLFTIIKNPKYLNKQLVLNTIFGLVYTILPYYVNRLMYSICVNSLR